MSNLMLHSLFFYRASKNYKSKEDSFFESSYTLEICKQNAYFVSKKVARMKMLKNKSRWTYYECENF